MTARRKNKPRKRAAKRVVIKERVDQIVELRKAGYTEQMIAQRLDLSQPQVSRALSEYLKQLHERTMNNLDEVRAMELSRLDAILVSHWRQRANAKSANIIIKIGERKSQLLGLDAPTSSNLNVNASASHILAGSIALDRMTPEHLQWFETILELYGPGSDPTVVSTQPGVSK